MTDPDIRNEGVPERRTWITAKLRVAGFLAITDIARELKVSTMTVRRDLHALQVAGEVRLVHGGAILSPADLHHRVFPDDGRTAARERVARYAAGMVETVDTIAVDAGPTAHAFVGPTTEAAVGELRARTFFFSPAAMDARGTYARSPAEASVQRRLIGIADAVVLVATHDVLSGSSPACVAALTALTSLITDRPVPRPVAAALHRADVVVHVAGDG